MRELSWLAILIGAAVGAALAAANAYIGLKVGLSVNASIPSAVVSLLIMRALARENSLLESNMVQTIGSAGQSLAAGMIFTIPALFILGCDPTVLEMVVWGSVGGLLGICFMVPLRRMLIVKEHGVLPYPEGVACAEVLLTGQRGGAGAMQVIWGAVVGGLFRLLSGLGFWPEIATTPVGTRFRTQGSLAVEPALLGVGYILGVRIAAVMLAGASLAWFVLIPAIAFFGAGGDAFIFPATDKPIAAMTPDEIHARYIKYIGAGAVAIGGLVSLLKSVPTIASSLWHVASGFFGLGKRSGDRTDRDLPLVVLILILAGLGYAMWKLPQIRVNPVGAVAVLVFGFFFVTVSSRLVGIVGASSNPASGMTIAALLGTCLAFKYVVGGAEADPVAMKVACLSVAAIVCSAICIAGDISQDLKTGFLVRATPWKQQVGEIVGILTSVALIAAVILLLAKNQGFTPSGASASAAGAAGQHHAHARRRRVGWEPAVGTGHHGRCGSRHSRTARQTGVTVRGWVLSAAVAVHADHGRRPHSLAGGSKEARDERARSGDVDRLRPRRGQRPDGHRIGGGDGLHLLVLERSALDQPSVGAGRERRSDAPPSLDLGAGGRDGTTLGSDCGVVERIADHSLRVGDHLAMVVGAKAAEADDRTATERGDVEQRIANKECQKDQRSDSSIRSSLFALRISRTFVPRDSLQIPCDLVNMGQIVPRFHAEHESERLGPSFVVPADAVKLRRSDPPPQA